ncbi:MAG: gliding motility protein GldL [Tannerella sp.]|jgi:gliding motility-associated protein GldL|nr:gliding motility protein GldL [Tannerella sp.]
MGKYKRYKNSIEMFLSSERGKRILNFLYSWGAAIVIIGALFKLLHIPYANQILFIAMITEACVFVISGFERPSNEYNWEEVFPVLKSKNPLDRPDFASGGVTADAVMAGSAGNVGGGTVIIGDLSGLGSGTGEDTGTDAGIRTGTGKESGAGIRIVAAMGGGAGMSGSGAATSGSGTATFGSGAVPQSSPQDIVNAGMATMGLNISEKDSEMLAESIKKLNSATEQISKMADLTEVTQTYIDQIASVSQNLEKFSEITGSLGEVSDSLIHSCKVISGSIEEGAEEKSIGYVEHMSKLNDNISEMNHFYESQLAGLRVQMDTIGHINSGLNRIRDMYDSSLVDSAAFRNENERMAQLLLQLNQVYSRLLQAMTVNVPMSGYPPPPAGQAGYPQPPYTGGYQPQGGNYR